MQLFDQDMAAWAADEGARVTLSVRVRGRGWFETGAEAEVMVLGRAATRMWHGRLAMSSGKGRV